MSENRYLLSFTTLLAGALVVCGPLVLLQATADPDNDWLGADPLTETPAFGGESWNTVVMAETAISYDDDALPPAVPLKPSGPDTTAAIPASPLSPIRRPRSLTPKPRRRRKPSSPRPRRRR